MKVLIISHMYPSASNQVSGIFVAEQVKKLARQGCEVKIISPIAWTPFPVKYLSKKWESYSQIPLEEEREGIKVYYPRQITFPSARLFEHSGSFMYYGIKKLVQTIYESFKFDLVNAYTILPDGFSALLLKKKIDVPIVITILGDDLLVYPYRNKWIFMNTRRTLAKATKIIAVSKHLKDRAVDEFGISEEKITVIYTGHDEKNFNLDERKQQEPSIKNILFLGNIIESKGVFDLLKAISIIRNSDEKLFKRLSWRFVGKISDKEKLTNFLNVYKLRNNVEVVGEVPRDEVAKYMKRADFFILPSWSEGMPVTLLEATACGLPVIATNVGGIPEVVNENTGVLVEPKKPQELACGIISALSRNWDRESIGEYAKKYTWEKNAEKTLGVYQEVLQGKNEN
ncbi:putative teichuronic acid biosynthesis glycosyltransferase TuaC [subsurface metagenome]